jgi:hypothetical protein
MSPVVAPFGDGLVVAAPERPGQHCIDRWKRPPDHATQEASDFRDGQRDERDQLADGGVSCPATRRG